MRNNRDTFCQTVKDESIKRLFVFDYDVQGKDIVPAIRAISEEDKTIPVLVKTQTVARVALLSAATKEDSFYFEEKLLERPVVLEKEVLEGELGQFKADADTAKAKLMAFLSSKCPEAVIIEGRIL